MDRIAKVVVEIALDREFDYLIPDALRGQVRLGSRVQVPFGHSDAHGYVIGLAAQSPRDDLKAIHSLVGTRPLLSESMLQLARWLGAYYGATIEQAIRTVLPCAVRRRGARFKERLFVLPAETAMPPDQLDALRHKAPLQADTLELVRNRQGLPLADLTRVDTGYAAAVKALVKKGWLRLEKDAAPRDPLAGQIILPTQPLPLFPEQAEALTLIARACDTLTPPVVLLHGVTGSGKTEVYLQAIRHALDRGKGAIVLVPEISLTPQTVERFRGRFGEAVAVLHSHLSDGERHDEWYRIYDGKARIVVGARSALFAPVAPLGLIVVDEEHEPSYKQADTPRYHARDVAVMRGRMEGCAVVLGSASPALESYYNVTRHKYALAALTHRVDHRPMPAMRVVDMRQEADGTGRYPLFSRVLAAALQERLAQAEQTILFLNRRGFATSLLCPRCGFKVGCERCSLALTYHKAGDELRCHICGRFQRAPARCPSCGDPGIRQAGTGTQRIEAVAQTLFPKARIRRMDADTTQRKEAYQRILGEFRSGQVDILIGTQMIAKGLHFPGVTLVGVINADLSLHQPDFRAAERTFQLIVQVAGRAGRGDSPGEVIIQTVTPQHGAIELARRLDYDAFVQQELEFRRELGYPPFGHIVCLTLDSTAADAVAQTAQTLADRLRPLLTAPVQLAGPMPAPLSKAKGRFRHQIIMRAPSAKTMVEPLKQILTAWRCPRTVHLAVDVDALDMM